MLFNSLDFIFLFLPLVAIGFHFSVKSAHSNFAFDWLIGASFVFYAWDHPRNLPVLLSSLLFNYAIARWMGEYDEENPTTLTQQHRKLLFIFGIILNLSFLGYYKYFSYLPLGISFFVLTQVMYLVDCYEGLVTPSTLREHALIVSFFPTVSMGPLLRTKEMLRQLRNPVALGVNAEQLAQAIFLFAIGFFKKIVIADSFSKLADAGYTSTATLSMLEAWGTSISYTLQIYYDFSGYSDMAVAAALVLGIQIPINFNSPYKARSVVEFWMHWHISLSNFITTYLFTPIIRSFHKRTFARVMWATFASMIIAGIWHGSSLNFMIFGAIHGIGLIVNQIRKKYKKKRFPALMAWMMTAFHVNFAFIFFRADSFTDAVNLLISLGNIHALVSTDTWHRSSLYITSRVDLLVPIILGAFLIFLKKNSNKLVLEFTPSWKTLAWAAVATLSSLVYLNIEIPNEFLYFRF